jgi:type VI secretion system secreted protein VgrG
MSKITYIGGNYTENIGGSKKTYVKGKHVINSNKQIIQTAANGTFYKKPKKPPVLEKITGLGIIYFRTKQDGTYNGEFGFDWLRQKDQGKTKEPDYKSIIESGYKDGKTDLSKIEAYTKLKKEYGKIPIIRKKPVKGEQYFVPYLTLFPKDFVDNLKLPAGGVKPKHTAELRLLVEIEEEIDKLEFEYNSTLFTIDKPILADKTKTNGIVDSKSISVKITCEKELTKNRYIDIYAHPKGTGNKTKAEQLTTRKLAGRLMVMQNDAKVRKEEKIVLVGVKTNVTTKKENTGTFTTKEKTNFYNALHQALIVPKIKNSSNPLDLSKNPYFQTITIKGVLKRGKYMNNPGVTGQGKSTEIWEDAPGFFKAIQDLFFNTKDAKGNLINTKYKTGYFTVFSLAAPVYDGAKGQIAAETYTVAGVTKLRFLKNLILFPNKDFCTMNHEGLHGFNLKHTHRDSSPIDEKNYRYIFPNAISNPPYQAAGDLKNSTDNVMCYRDIGITTWRWQWRILNTNMQ